MKERGEITITVVVEEVEEVVVTPEIKMITIADRSAPLSTDVKDLTTGIEVKEWIVVVIEQSVVVIEQSVVVIEQSVAVIELIVAVIELIVAVIELIVAVIELIVAVIVVIEWIAMVIETVEERGVDTEMIGEDIETIEIENQGTIDPLVTHFPSPTTLLTLRTWGTWTMTFVRKT